MVVVVGWLGVVGCGKVVVRAICSGVTPAAHKSHTNVKSKSSGAPAPVTNARGHSQLRASAHM